MKFIVIGLGYFGSTLAVNLTQQGHEVIGIDNRYEKVEEFKDSITHVMEMDTTNERAVKSLPLDDADAVIVAIGEDVGSSILTLSILKNMNIKRIIGRIISTVHHTILNQIGIYETIHPEEATAYTVISMLQLPNAINVFELGNDDVISECFIPAKYIGHTPESLNLSKRFNLKMVGIKKAPATKGINSIIKKDYELILDFDPYYVFQEKDIILIAGKLPNVRKFMEG